MATNININQHPIEAIDAYHLIYIYKRLANRGISLIEIFCDNFTVAQSYTLHVSDYSLG